MTSRWLHDFESLYKTGMMHRELCNFAKKILKKNFSSIFCLLHAARCSKIGKKCNFKITKTHFFAMSKIAKKKSIFAQEKSLKRFFWTFSWCKN